MQVANSADMKTSYQEQLSIILIVTLITAETNLEELRKYSTTYLLFTRGKKRINIAINCTNSNKYFGCCPGNVPTERIFFFFVLPLSLHRS